MTTPTLLATSIVHVRTPLGEQVRAAAAGGADLVELRVDCLGDVEAAAELLRQPRRLPLIVTIRVREEGGQWDGDEERRRALFARLGRLRPDYLDVEYARWVAAPRLRRTLQRLCAAGGERPGGARGDGALATPTAAAPAGAPRLILSHHDLRGTPADPQAALRPLLDAPADVLKVVCTAREATQAAQLLSWLHHHAGSRPLAVMALGPAGLPTRVLAPKCGAFLTFAALEPGAEAAPGQPTLHELCAVYRWREVRPTTRVYGVVGWPVAHSRGPHAHNAAMRHAGIDGVYLPWAVAPAEDAFVAFMEALRAHPRLDVRGLSVTLPHKEHAWRWLRANGRSVTSAAQRAGAVNTLTRDDDGGWSGDNTDVAGVHFALHTLGRDELKRLPCAAALVLGAGGAARAAVLALHELGCRVTVCNRTAARAAALAHELRCAWRPWTERAAAPAALVVNATSVGMYPDVDESPLPAQALRPGQIIFDAVYNPPQTRLVREAQQRGCRVLLGEALFIGQAARQFELWHGREAPVDAMRAAAWEAAARRPPAPDAG